MESYIGCKIIKAKKMTLGEFRKTKNQFVEEDIKNDLEGYMIVYPPLGVDDEKPYISWSPKHVFLTCYRKIQDSEISILIE